MARRTQPQLHLSLLLVLAETICASALVIAAAWADRAGRSGGPEAPVFAYAAAIQREDLQGALQQLLPDSRAQAASFVSWQLGNRYTILESAVRTSSLLDRILGKGNLQPEVIVTMEIEEEGAVRWRTVEEVPVTLVDGRWYLLKPPLQPPA